MKIAVLSGKGGTGKTLVSVNLASMMKAAIYMDCDVEEPNGHLFFKPENTQVNNVSVWIPDIDSEKCTGCRACAVFCKFNALAYINQKIKVFESVCHACGGCALICPEKAITERPKSIGVIEAGVSQSVEVVTGRLNTGEESGVPIIKALLKMKKEETRPMVIDCPPGSSCMVMESIQDADFCLLVAEPTIFGRHNLEMVYELVTLFQKPFGVLLNKTVTGENPSEIFCLENNIPILGRIPFDSQLGTINSNGGIVAREDAHYKMLFETLLKNIEDEVQP